MRPTNEVCEMQINQMESIGLVSLVCCYLQLWQLMSRVFSCMFTMQLICSSQQSRMLRCEMGEMEKIYT